MTSTKCYKFKSTVGYVSSSSLYPKYSTDSSIVLCMVLMRVSGRCTVLMVLLTSTEQCVVYCSTGTMYDTHGKY